MHIIYRPPITADPGCGRFVLVARMLRAAAGVALTAFTVTTSAAPSVFPTGTTIYAPAQAWNGFTAFITPDTDGGVLIDMNGHVVKQWKQFSGVSGGPFRVLPGGYAMGPGGARPGHLEAFSLLEVDWDGKVVWRYDHNEQVDGADGKKIWSARQHHDWQREGSPAGYYAPGTEPLATSGRTLVLAHRAVTVPAIADGELEDDYIVELDWNGKVLWEWHASDHIDELGFSSDARAAIRRAGASARGAFDWLHLNSLSYVGPNHWYDDGDARFNPENLIISSRQASIIAIIDRKGTVVWRTGPDYRDNEALAKLGQIIGQHHPHMIPKGLPGAGNILVFDNGGASGYGFTTPSAPNGENALGRASSRVIEFDPVTYNKVWQYTIGGLEHYRFYSFYISSAQRLPNGNTLITEGADGRLFEVTPAKEIVWEYVSPFFAQTPPPPGMPPSHRVYRAYRVPYDWVPQVPRPEERPVTPPQLGDFHVPAD